MRLGIFAKIFVRPGVEETLNAAAAGGFECVQFNYACAGLPTLPDRIPAGLPEQIAAAARQRNITIAAVSGTFNLIDPDTSRRRAGLRRLEELASSCAGLGTPLITLCTGTCDPEDMWRNHPDNDSPRAWSDLLVSIAEAIQIADKHNILLGIEPETSNVVSSAAKARLLLSEMRSPRLKIVMDASNLFHPGDTTKKEEVLAEAFDLLGGDIALAHAKDFRDTGKMEYMAPGQGDLPWALYLRLLRSSGYCGPLVMHSLPEADAKPAAAFLRKTMSFSERPARLPVSAEFMRDGIRFNYQESGRGVPFFFQHGLTADVTQPFLLFQPPAGFRLYSFDCRAHGQTRPAGPEDKISIAAFADDLGAFMDHVKIEKAVVGGISMGAAVALNFALRNPHRVRALVLQRPAWLDGPRRENVEIYAAMAKLIRGHGGVKGLEIFKATPVFQKVFKESPNAAKSLIGQFLHPRAEESVALLEKIPLDAPCQDRSGWKKIAVPTLVLANRQDPIHPFEYGETLAREIPGAVFRELTPKSASVEKHNAEAQQYIEDFLLQHF